MEEQNFNPQPQAQPQPAQFQVPASQPILPEAFEMLKARAREEALRITLEQSGLAAAGLSAVPPGVPNPQNIPIKLPETFVKQTIKPNNEPKIIYVKRNLTIAELALVFVVSCGLVTGVQVAWKGLSAVIPHIELKVK